MKSFFVQTWVFATSLLHIFLCFKLVVCTDCDAIPLLSLAESKRLVLFLWTTVILILLFYCFDMKYLMNGYVHHRTTLSTSYEFTSHLVLVFVVVGFFFFLFSFLAWVPILHADAVVTLTSLWKSNMISELGWILWLFSACILTRPVEAG